MRAGNLAVIIALGLAVASYANGFIHDQSNSSEALPTYGILKVSVIRNIGLGSVVENHKEDLAGSLCRELYSTELFPFFSDAASGAIVCPAKENTWTISMKDGKVAAVIYAQPITGDPDNSEVVNYIDTYLKSKYGFAPKLTHAQNKTTWEWVSDDKSYSLKAILGRNNRVPFGIDEIAKSVVLVLYSNKIAYDYNLQQTQREFKP